MNSKERFEAVLLKKKTDKIPVNHRGFSSKAASYIIGREAYVGGGIQQWRESKSLFEGWHEEFLERSFRDAVDLSLATRQDMIRPGYWRLPKKPTGKIDENTYLYACGEEKDWEVLRFNPESEQANTFPRLPRETTIDDLKKEVNDNDKKVASYQPSESDFAESIKAQGLYLDKYAVEVGGVGVGIPARNANIWMEMMLLDPGVVEAHINQQVETARRNVAFLSKYKFRYFLGGGDFASENGPFYSPPLFRKLILPGIKKVSEICHEYGGYHFFASDGNLWPVSQYLFGESGTDVYFEIDRKAGMDLELLRQRFPNLSLLGNISSWTLARGTKETVRQEVLSCLETAKKYGGIIAGVSNYILAETPPENMDTLLETIEKER
ncbi:MAG: uroporphyrinogen decarboxylase family protein [Candidatus Omnitrophota bacterium]